MLNTVYMPMKPSKVNRALPDEIMRARRQP